MASSWETESETQVKRNKTAFQTLGTVFMSRPRRRFGAS